MLGINISTAYEVIKRYGLETVIVDHCLRVTKDSFDKWYAGQDKYRNREDHKKDEEILKATVSMPEMARLLGLPRSNVYSILKSRQYGHLFDSRIVAGQKRITWESFDRFLAAQDKYHLYYPADKTGKVPEQNGRLANYRKKIAMNAEDTRPVGTKDYLTVEEAAAMASVTKATIYNWLGRGYFPVKKVGRSARIPRKDFENWQQKTALERIGE